MGVGSFLTQEESMSVQYKRCDCYQCSNTLRSYDEVISGICEPHFELAVKDENYIGVCWNCLRITLIGTRLDNKDRLVIKDKYIFSKGCRHCTGNEEDNISWMTIKGNLPYSNYVTKEGRILPITTVNDQKTVNQVVSKEM